MFVPWSAASETLEQFNEKRPLSFSNLVRGSKGEKESLRTLELHLMVKSTRL